MRRPLPLHDAIGEDHIPRSSLIPPIPKAVYTTCMFCKRTLGANEVVEVFPVGRRLAFDAAKGCLWVVSRSCERFRQSPGSVRWIPSKTEEAVEKTTVDEDDGP